jgi:hypothetical protein
MLNAPASHFSPTRGRLTTYAAWRVGRAGSARGPLRTFRLIATPYATRSQREQDTTAATLSQDLRGSYWMTVLVKIAHHLDDADMLLEGRSGPVMVHLASRAGVPTRKRTPIGSIDGASVRSVQCE